MPIHFRSKLNQEKSKSSILYLETRSLPINYNKYTFAIMTCSCYVFVIMKR